MQLRFIRFSGGWVGGCAGTRDPGSACLPYRQRRPADERSSRRLRELVHGRAQPTRGGPWARSDARGDASRAGSCVMRARVREPVPHERSFEMASGLHTALGMFKRARWPHVL